MFGNVSLTPHFEQGSCYGDDRHVTGRASKKSKVSEKGMGGKLSRLNRLHSLNYLRSFSWQACGTIGTRIFCWTPGGFDWPGREIAGHVQDIVAANEADGR